MTILKAIGFGIAGLAVGWLVSAAMQGQLFGGVYNQVENTFRQGIKVGTSDQFAINSSGTITTGATISGDGVVSGGTLNVTTANTATSSAILGCIQTYATSTATAIRLVPLSTAVASTSYSGSNAVAGVGWQYGTCPNL